MERRALLLIALVGAAAPSSGCLCSAVIDPDPALLGGEGEVDGGSCDDSVGCTFDTRNEDGECVHEPDDAICGEGHLCFPSAGCIPLRPCARDEDCADGNLCTTDRCESDRRACEPAEAVDCGNGVFCDGDEACSPLDGCLPSPAPRDCRDAVDCTADACDEDTDACVHEPVHSICADARACNGPEVCDVDDGCLPGTPACPDDGDCAPESCLEQVGGTAECTTFPDHSLCAWGTLCDDGDGNGDYSCDERPCAGDGECDDGEACNGLETCGESGFCLAGTGLVCDDGYFCNGTEVCASGACASSVPPTCDDGVGCTLDRCDGLADICAHDPDAGACEDGVFCNGAEICEEAGCAPAAPLDCEDGSDCTTNGCDEDADTCLSAPTPELCNGLDEDCNGSTDDGFACALGATRACTSACSGAVGTEACGADCSWLGCLVAEDCNGVDDDCDGETDEGCGDCVPEETGMCTTTCSTTGARTCQPDGTWGPCDPPAEACNGVDDDCNLTVDDGFECVTGDQEACTTQCDTPGYRVCDGQCTWGPCLPFDEVCNGADDDCDADRDEDFACIQGQTIPCDTPCGGVGVATCGDTCTLLSCEPPAEVCNGADDDCDGSCDEDFGCCAGEEIGRCSSACNTAGFLVCDANCQTSQCVATAVCNGVDDDCDGTPDQGFECPAYLGFETCSMGGGVSGVRRCGAGCTWGSCCALSEVCDNGVDDDCNGATDDAGCCTQGQGAEVCNGADDDCDGLCDEDEDCCLGQSGYCVTSCNTLGTRSCEAGCAWSACQPPDEVCDNLVDDDCNGQIDEVVCP